MPCGLGTQMRILFHASHLLHWRSLIPVACELSRRGHEIVVQTSRPDWLGMPTYQMNWRPTKVTGINKTSLTWLAGKMGWGQEWQSKQPRISYPCLGLDHLDAAVTTTKDLAWARQQKEAGIQAFAVGYQHFPAVMQIGVGPCTWAYMPKPFWYEEPFAKAHEFEMIMCLGPGRSCGFPHLDKVPKATTLPKENIVAIQHHGGYRGLVGHQWLSRLVRIVENSGYRSDVILHPIPGLGYGKRAVGRAVSQRAVIWDTQWEIADRARYVLTTGSSSAYDHWSVGLKNVYVLTYLGGGRDKAFRTFPDICINSEDELKLLLSGQMWEGNYPMTKEVMDAFETVHTGQGEKTAADVIEGKR